jgi:hypothetical protein
MQKLGAKDKALTNRERVELTAFTIGWCKFGVADLRGNHPVAPIQAASVAEP